MSELLDLLRRDIDKLRDYSISIEMSINYDFVCDTIEYMEMSVITIMWCEYASGFDDMMNSQSDGFLSS